MTAGVNGSAVTTSHIGSNTSGGDLQLISIEEVDREIADIDASIKKILEGSTGNTYRSTIKFIADSEGRLNRKEPNIRQKEIGVLKGNLLIWKEFIGSEICTILDLDLIKQAQEFRDRYHLSDDQIEMHIEDLRLCTHELAGKMLKSNEVCNTKTQGGLFHFDTNKRIKITPDVLKTYWPENKGRIPELLILIDVLNLMIVKIELLSKKTILANFEIFKMNIGDILVQQGSNNK